MGKNIYNSLKWAALICFLLAIIVFIFHEAIWQKIEPIWTFLSDKESLRQYIEGFGVWAPLIFMGMQIAQVLIAPVPGEITGLVGGYVFGWQWGMVYSTIALTVGSLVNFGVARLLGRSLVERWVPANTLRKIDRVMERQGVITCFMCFIIPGFPKDYLCLALGLTPLNWRIFLGICAIGRLPGTLMLSLQGAAVYQGNYWSFLWVTLIALAFLVPVYIWRDKIYDLTCRLDRKADKDH